MGGRPFAADDTIHLNCTLFNTFNDTGRDTLAETFFDYMMQEMTDLFLVLSI